jgi:hypothetical protein
MCIELQLNRWLRCFHQRGLTHVRICQSDDPTWCTETQSSIIDQRRRFQLRNCRPVPITFARCPTIAKISNTPICTFSLRYFLATLIQVKDVR